MSSFQPSPSNSQTAAAAIQHNGSISRVAQSRGNGSDPNPNPTRKKAVSRRKQSKLEPLLYLSMDIWLEVVSNLEPLDILRISRVSKEFRSFFNPYRREPDKENPNGSHSHLLWIDARRNLSIKLPECPRDLNEAQYAALVFETHCMECGKQQGQIRDFSLHIRVCSSCHEQLVVSGPSALRAAGVEHNKIYNPSGPSYYELSPRSIIKRKVLRRRNQDSRYGNYLKKDLIDLTKNYTALEESGDPVKLAEFVHKHLEMACERAEVRDLLLLYHDFLDPTLDIWM
jgi:hypothetical protein